jgi:serine/threonine protein kinase
VKKKAVLSTVVSVPGMSSSVFVGAGSSADVFRGRYQNAHDVAVKVFHDAAAFASELRVRSLFPERIVDALVLGDGRGVLILPWASGEPLGRDAQLSEGEVIRVLGQCAAQLVRLHAAGVRHGDVKCENILADENQYTLIDLSLAAFMGEPLVGGTPRYLPADLSRTGECDLYALGLSMWELLNPDLRKLERVLFPPPGTELERVLHALTLPSGRPSAAFVARWAAQRVPLQNEASHDDRVRTAYLAIRERLMKPGAEPSHLVEGTPRAWLLHALTLRKKGALTACKPSVLEPMRALERMRLLAVFGLETDDGFGALESEADFVAGIIRSGETLQASQDATTLQTPMAKLRTCAKICLWRLNKKPSKRPNLGLHLPKLGCEKGRSRAPRLHWGNPKRVRSCFERS